MLASSVDMTAGTPGDMYLVDKHEKCLQAPEKNNYCFSHSAFTESRVSHLAKRSSFLFMFWGV